jgi:hypothetical protein
MFYCFEILALLIEFYKEQKNSRIRWGQCRKIVSVESGKDYDEERTVFFWVVTQRVVIQCSLTMGRIGCPETSVSSYHYSLRNSPERCSSPLCGGRLCSFNWMSHSRNLTLKVLILCITLMSLSLRSSSLFVLFKWQSHPQGNRDLLSTLHHSFFLYFCSYFRRIIIIISVNKSRSLFKTGPLT